MGIGAVGLDVDGGRQGSLESMMEVVFNPVGGLMAGGETQLGVDLDAGGEVKSVPLEPESELGHVSNPFDGANDRFCPGHQGGVDSVEETPADPPRRRDQEPGNDYCNHEARRRVHPGNTKSSTDPSGDHGE